MTREEFLGQAKAVNLLDAVKYTILNNQLYLQFPEGYKFTVSECQDLLNGKFRPLRTYQTAAPAPQLKIPPVNQRTVNPSTSQPVRRVLKKKSSSGTTAILGLFFFFVIAAIVFVGYNLIPRSPKPEDSCPAGTNVITLHFVERTIQDQKGVFPGDMITLKDKPTCLVFSADWLSQSYAQHFSNLKSSNGTEDLMGIQLIANTIKKYTAAEQGKDLNKPEDRAWAEEIYNKVLDALNPARFKDIGNGMAYLILPSLTGENEPVTQPTTAPTQAGPNATQPFSAPTQAPGSQATVTPQPTYINATNPTIRYLDVNSYLSNQGWQGIIGNCPENLTGLVEFHSYSKDNFVTQFGGINVDFTGFPSIAGYTKAMCQQYGGVYLDSATQNHSSQQMWSKIGDLWFAPNGFQPKNDKPVEQQPGNADLLAQAGIGHAATPTPTAAPVPELVTIWELADVFQQQQWTLLVTPCVSTKGMKQIIDFGPTKVDLSDWLFAPYYTAESCKTNGDGTIKIEMVKHYGDPQWIQAGNLWIFPSGCPKSGCVTARIANRDIPRHIIDFYHDFVAVGATNAESDGHDKFNWLMRFTTADGTKEYMVLNTAADVPPECVYANKIYLSTSNLTGYKVIDSLGNFWIKCVK